ncbi:DUF4302 domain-containing protein [Pedobacter sp. FW305-3-2-15-E-R2A2]|uniref:DUF4302 domain-containing protein n=1 Tax=Pedobacter sp. FW305-3-2-15-E-R2A2 TaxID=3140251 RepID=UPI0031405585
MKNLLLYFLLLTTVFVSCRKDDTKPIMGNVDERLNETLTAYQTQLAGAAYGWKAVVFPSKGYGFGHFFKFDDKNRVTMYSDFNLEGQTKSLESSYRLKALQQPTLLFDTYSYLHILQDPTPSLSEGGELGQGWYADFEFKFVSATTDTIKLTGLYNQSPLVLVRASKEDYDSYNAKGLEVMDEATQEYVSQPTFKYLDLGDGKQIQCNIDPNTKSFVMIYKDNSNSIVAPITQFGYMNSSLFLKEYVSFNGVAFNELFWDNVKESFYVKVGGKRYDFQNSATAPFNLNSLLGVSFNTLDIDTSVPLEGASPDFMLKVDSFKALCEAAYGLTLTNMTFKFKPVNNTMILDCIVLQEGRAFIATFPFSYTKDANNVYKFQQIPAGNNGNAGLLVSFIKPIFDVLNADKFTLDYFNVRLGQFKSIERPGFYFSGNLIKN